jgi:hypothetical protein
LNWTAPVFPPQVVLQALVMVAPAGSVILNVHPLTGEEPAVTRTVATKPSVHWLMDTDAEQPTPDRVAAHVLGDAAPPRPPHPDAS